MEIYAVFLSHFEPTFTSSIPQKEMSGARGKQGDCETVWLDCKIVVAIFRSEIMIWGPFHFMFFLTIISWIFFPLV